jgi:hypothetical protein
MISSDSVLRHLPANIDRKQALVLDGLRHSAEIASFAYRRLQQTLSEIAISQPAATDSYTSAFLDAWAFVDAIDRFRSLWDLLPQLMGKPLEAAETSFSNQTLVIRNLRNVADHLAARADYVVARKGAALGILEWVTVTRAEQNEGLMCVLVPGTSQGRTIQHRTAQVGQQVELPSGFIRLSAGEHEGDLSAVMPELESRVRELEDEIARFLSTLDSERPHPAADLLVKLFFKIS